jgi:molybdopterin converting factor subunit 1
MKVLYFAQCAEWMNCREAEISLEEAVRLSDLIKTSPDLAPLQEHLKALKVSVNREIVDMDVEVCDRDEVAFLPPISGG